MSRIKGHVKEDHSSNTSFQSITRGRLRGVIKLDKILRSILKRSETPEERTQNDEVEEGALPGGAPGSGGPGARGDEEDGAASPAPSTRLWSDPPATPVPFLPGLKEECTVAPARLAPDPAEEGAAAPAAFARLSPELYNPSLFCSFYCTKLIWSSYIRKSEEKKPVITKHIGGFVGSRHSLTKNSPPLVSPSHGISERNRRQIESDMELGESGIERLPELCVAHAISLASPRDACRLSAVSAAFRCAATSDTVWDRFLPTDWQSLVSRAVYPVEFSSSSSKRDIFFRLCDPILIDDGKMVRTDPLTLVF
ncbi:hypothetical protein B296_00026492 [Ensete ventricosum]|uniref:F-box domain-containing protein n=1 Tax=Ensete ventricosum TaxID=4639 RepID=A0A427ARL7_ENSVE|nr:hypothetical protein B296_00026492 [Ensete ventricosum]